MFGKAAGDILERGLDALSKDVASEHSKVRAIFRNIASYLLDGVQSGRELIPNVWMRVFRQLDSCETSRLCWAYASALCY